MSGGASWRQPNPFYTSSAWRGKRRGILARDKNECQSCRAKGRYSRAAVVHHVRHLDEYPELALSDTYTDEGGVERRQLVSLCRECHEREHGSLGTFKRNPPVTAERW